jgi:hypothetical protein
MMKKRTLLSRRPVRPAILAAALTAAFLTFVPAAATESPFGNGLFAYVVASNRGPLPPCATNCTAANFVWDFVHVINANRLTNVVGFTDRTTWPNSFVVTSVDSTTFVNGASQGTFTITPPPNASPLSWSGHWPSTVDCEGQPGAFHTPCDVVLNPAVLPGENVAAVYTGFVHSVGELNGTYVFKYTIHGTLNGMPVNLSASSAPIQMTG